MKEIRERLQEVKISYGKSYRLLAIKLNDTEDRLKGMFTGRQRVSDDLLFKVVSQLNINAHWLLTGEGEMHQSQSHDQTHSDTIPIPVISAQEKLVKNQRESKITAFIQHWFAAKSMDEQVWFEVQLRHSFPQYQDFISNKEMKGKIATLPKIVPHPL